MRPGVPGEKDICKNGPGEMERVFPVPARINAPPGPFRASDSFRFGSMW